MEKVLLEITLIFNKEETHWNSTEDVERDLARFLAGCGLEGRRMISPGKLGISVQKKSGDFPTVSPENKPAANPNPKARQQISDYSSLLDTLKKAAPRKPRLKIFRETIL